MVEGAGGTDGSVSPASGAGAWGHALFPDRQAAGERKNKGPGAAFHAGGDVWVSGRALGPGAGGSSGCEPFHFPRRIGEKEPERRRLGRDALALPLTRKSSWESFIF